MMISDGSCDS